ncbi:MAG: alpha-amylase family glycosyl hydrolase [Archangium sp.]|nr:alpha-amylase family glycosyl hydrolase [Archangium sp.]
MKRRPSVQPERSRGATVTFRYRGAPGHRVELAGDLPFWTERHPMPEVSPGEYVVRLSLKPGLYRYKFLVDRRHWVRDPDAPVDFAEGSDNSVLIVGGTRAPLFFAEDRRHLVRTADGTLRVAAELDEANAPPPRLWARDDDGGEWTAPVHEVGRHGGRRLLRAELALPRSLKSATWGFEGVPESIFSLPAPQPAVARRPGWATSAVWYAIFLDRWHRGSNTKDARLHPRTTPTSATTFYGGDLDGVRASLGHLKDLGVDGVVLSPLHRSETPHRYDTVDFLSIDPRLGGRRAWKRLLDEAHQRGLRVAADLSFTHVHERHPFFQDVLKRQRRSKYAKWFKLTGERTRAGDRTSYGCYAGRTELPLLDLTHDPPRAHVIAAALELVNDGVDALRLDAMTDAPGELWRELRAAVHQANPDVALLGEVVMDAQPLCLEDAGADAVTDFQHREALKDLCLARIDAAQFLSRSRLLEHRQGPFDSASRLRLLDTHDTERFASMVGVAKTRLALAWLLLRPEPVWLTYGTERELAANVPLFRLDDAWPERLPMPALDEPAPATHRLIKALLALRKGLRPEAFATGADGRVLWLERTARDGARLRLVLNFGDEPVGCEGTSILGINDDSGRALAPGTGRVVLQGKTSAADRSR